MTPPAIRFLTALMGCCLVVQARSAPREIPLPEGVSGARCVADDGRNWSSQPKDTTLRVDCDGGPGTVVRCDFDGGEPLDLSLGALCAAATVPAIRARTVRVRARGSTAAPVTVEWLTVGGPPDGGVSVVARRNLIPDDTAQLAVARRDDRFVTFLRAGASPVTVRGDALDVPGGWTLPDPVPGGELVARLAAAPVSPVRYHLRGSAPADAMPVQTVVSFRGVPPGAYQLAPEYEGGLPGQRTSVAMRSGQTTFLALPAEPVGAAQIATDAPLCDPAITLAIAGTRNAGANGISATWRVLAVPARPECVQTIAGLTPGDYRVSFLGKHGEVAVAPFQIAAQVVTGVSVGAETTRVTGRVTLNGRPLARANVSFIADGFRRPPVDTETDADGRYELALSEPGHFMVWFQRDGFDMLGNEREATVTAGANSLDWNLKGATLKVNLKGWTRSAPVDIRLTQLEMWRPGKTGDGRRISPSDSLPSVFSGINFGRYALEAREYLGRDAAHGRLAGATVNLEEAHPEAEIELELTDNRGIIRVFDETGRPLSDASIRLTSPAASLIGADHLEETSPGVFSLGNMAPGGHVFASAPGYTPVCRLIPNQSPFDIVLTRGIEVRLHYVAGNQPSAAGIFSWPGTECPLPIHLFTVTRSPDATGDFIVHDFPADPDVVIFAGPFDPRTTPARPDANGVIQIK